MPKSLSTLLPRAAALVLVALAATATLTYAAGRDINTATPASSPTLKAPTVLVPDVKNQAFVFAKGGLEDAGFAWRVVGSVRGYSANTVVSQSPAAGTKLLDNGAPLVKLTLKRNSKYKQVGLAEDASPYAATAAQLVGLTGQVLGPAAKPKKAAAVGKKPKKQPAQPKKMPAAPATTPAKTTAAPATTPAKTTAAPATTPAKTTATPTTPTPAAKPQQRPVAFVVPGAQKEPLDEMPLPQRAKLLEHWLAAHPKPTDANVKHWLYQNEWIVAGAKFGWWRGAEALRTLVAVDKQTQSMWGVGAKSATAATVALGYVVARSKP